MIDPTADGFFAFINLRHKIYIRKERGDPRPWTKNKILHEGKFTNIYRMLDRVSKFVTREILDVFSPWEKNHAEQLVFLVIAFRLFNWPDTYLYLQDLLWNEWGEERAKRILRKAQTRGEKIFTGAWVVTNNGEERPKIDIVCEAVTEARRVAPQIVAAIRKDRTIFAATTAIERLVPCAGRFIAYEMASDLRWTPLLRKASDIHTWANPGPGAQKGIHWLKHGHDGWTGAKPYYVDEMRWLLAESRKPGRLGDHMDPLEMRDIEHSLCEFSKYLRVKYKGGKMKSKYTPTPDDHPW